MAPRHGIEFHRRMLQTPSALTAFVLLVVACLAHGSDAQAAIGPAERQALLNIYADTLIQIVANTACSLIPRRTIPST